MIPVLAVILGVIITGQGFCQVPMILEDDYASDSSNAAFVSFFKLADHNEIQALGLIADSANDLTAPAFHVMSAFYGRTSSLSIGANETSSPACSNGCNTSGFLSSLIGQYDAGDTRANYTDCVTVYRTILAANTGVTIVETGNAVCLVSLLSSGADGISPLTGAQLCQMKVTKLVVMGGHNPSGAEFNYQSNPSGFSTLFTTWTSQNGYPPLWMVSFEEGTGTNAGAPTYPISTANPFVWVAGHGGVNQRPVWDGLAVLYGARGLSTYFTDAGNGTQTVNASNGSNSWSTSTASGQHYLTNAASTTVLSQVFDGFSYGFGFAALPPGANLGTYATGLITFSGAVGVQ